MAPFHFMHSIVCGFVTAGPPGSLVPIFLLDTSMSAALHSSQAHTYYYCTPWFFHFVSGSCNTTEGFHSYPLLFTPLFRVHPL